ncbi:hypothetical protein [Paenibacillus sp. FSL H7-0331]|uniref:hypothetical protein n=1 Tax=Paenibacillus sp. FSL H7-0331 TaxID=1920421 RepID=UPI003558CC59
MEQYPSAAQMCSWEGFCPGQNEVAGKRISGKTRKGNKKLLQERRERTYPANITALQHAVVPIVQPLP